MAHQLKVRMVKQVLDIGLASGEVIVNAKHVLTAFEQSLTKVGSQKARATGDQDFLHSLTIAS